MSRTALALETDAGKSSSARMGSGVRVSKPGDTHEVEADRVADTVLRGGSVPGWSLAAKGFDGIQRKPAESHGDAVAQAEQALLASAEGRAAIAKVTAGAAAGMVVTGAAAAGVVAALATGRKGTAGAASIALDGIHPGLSLKVAREGGAGGAAVALSYTPKTEGKHAAPGKHAGPKVVEKPEVKSAPHPARDDKAVTSGASQHGAAVHEGGKKEELTVHRKAEQGEAIYTGSAEVDSVLRSPGREMEPATRREMESRIGFDFGRVRLHTDERAGESARGLSARAYTVGSDVVFAPGRYAPQTTEGRHLLAHELTHVVQQTSGAERGRAAGLHVAKPAARVVQRAWAGRDIPGVGWLLDKVKGLKGYSLFCVVIGKDLIDDQEVERNATTLTKGVLNLFDGGPALYEKLQKAKGALETAYKWLTGEIDRLGLSEKYFSDLLDKAWAAVDKWHPFDSWERVKGLLKEPLDKLLELAGEIAKKVMDFILEAALDAFPAGRKVYGILKKAGDAITKILADPLSFAKNLFAAVQEGFKNFGLNILEHLGEGLKKWIFEELAIKGVTIPTEFTFASVLKLVLQVLGLTYEQRRPQLVEKLGEPAVEFFETTAKVLDRVRKEGFSAIWEMVKEKASSIFDSLIGSIKEWVVKQIVTRGLLMVAALANPIGDFIEIVGSIYETLEFIVEKASKLVDLVETVVNALSDIVAGAIGPAAKKVEDSLAKTIPLLLRFLAGLLHLSGIGASIRKIIDDVRKPIDDVIGKVLDFIVEKAKGLWEAGKAAFTAGLEKVKNWWTKPRKFNYGEEQHELVIKGKPDHPEVVVHSGEEKPLQQFVTDVKAPAGKKQKILATAKSLSWKEGEAQKPSDDVQGSAKFDQLTNEMAGLKPLGPHPSDVRDNKPKHEIGSADSAEAFLSTSVTEGTKAQGDNTDPPDPAAWTDLGYLRGRKEKNYIRGHLIHNEFGGHAKWPNLMPITNGANQRMYHKVEKQLKKAIKDKNNIHAYHYAVKAHYEPNALPPVKPDDTEDVQHDRARLADARLVSLSWTVKDAQFDEGLKSWKETDETPRDQDNNAFPATVTADSQPANVR
jgi:hypothetical protein